MHTTPIYTPATDSPHTVRLARLGVPAQEQRRPAAQAGGVSATSTSRPSGRPAHHNINTYSTNMCDMCEFPLIEQREGSHENMGKTFGVSSRVGVGGKSGGKGCSDCF